jgi:hypothetical protein
MATGIERSYRTWLAAIGLVLIVALGLLAYGQLTSAPSQTVVTKLTAGGDTAHQAFPPADELAVQWQQDARLVGVSGQLPTIGKGSGNEIEWGFQFFSPATQEMAVVVVSGGEARMVRPPMLSPYRLSTFSSDEWLIDSDQALQTWWEHGGDSLVKQYSRVNAVIRLRISEEWGSQPVWVIAGVVADKSTVLTLFVNASDGSVIDARWGEGS